MDAKIKLQKIDKYSNQITVELSDIPENMLSETVRRIKYICDTTGRHKGEISIETESNKTTIIISGNISRRLYTKIKDEEITGFLGIKGKPKTTKSKREPSQKERKCRVVIGICEDFIDMFIGNYETFIYA